MTFLLRAREAWGMKERETIKRQKRTTGLRNFKNKKV